MNASHSELISQWVEEHTSELLGHARQRVNDPQLAEDLVQDTFVAAFQGLGKFKEDSTPRTWLFSILRHKLMDHYRKAFKMRQVSLDTDGPSPFDERGMWLEDHRPADWGDTELLDDPDFQRILALCMGHLPEHWGVVIRMKYLDEKKADAICKELGITTTNYWQIAHRAKLQLRQCVEKGWHNER
jgi:RNA polymerase sigma-70 factor (TIGR02943 family)